MTGTPAGPASPGQSVSGAVGGHNIQIGSAGDVTILLDRPDYRLEFCLPQPEAARVPGSQRGPGFLLDPRSQVVPYRNRPAEQQRLYTWRDKPDEPISALLLHGQGGQGKTRMAGWFASASHAQGWAVAQAVEKTPRLRAGRGQAPTLADGQPLLVVVDYAERWKLPTLTAMVDNLRFDYPDRVVRVLLLARPLSGWWEAVTAEIDGCLVDHEAPLDLGAFVAGEDRTEAFAEAAQAFAERLDASTADIPPAKNLNEGDYASPLTLHMTALAAVYARLGGESPPERAELSRYLLGHEQRYWNAAASDSIPTGTIRAVVFTATLFGPVSNRAEACALLRRAGLADGQAAAARLVDLHQRLYPPFPRLQPDGAPPATSAMGEVMPPLRPDRFGEDFVAQELATGAGAAELLGTVLGEAYSGDEHSVLRRCLVLLSAAGARHDVVRNALFDLLTVRPALVEYAPTPIVDLVVAHGTYRLSTAVDAALPRFSTNLLDAAATLAEHLVTVLPPYAALAERASRLNTLGVRLADGGRRDEALGPAEEAVVIRRRLAEKNPAAYLPDLAAALNNLGSLLADVGRRDEALGPAEEAVVIRRRLAEKNPAAYLPDLASALNNLGVGLAGVGRQDEALGPAEEAVVIRRRLAEKNPAAYLPDLAAALNNLGIWLAGVGRQEEALELAEEAVAAYRRLAEKNPAAYLPDLASALNNLGIWLAGVGRQEEALEPAEEAVAAYRRLAEGNPAAYLPDLAMSLNNLGSRLAGVGRREEALEPAEEAVAAYRRLAEKNPAAYLPDLAAALNNLGVGLAGVGRREEALEPAEEAVVIRRRLAEKNPAAYLPDLAAALNNLGIWLAGVGRREEALEPAEEAVAAYRRLAEKNPAVYLPDLAMSLWAKGWVHFKIDICTDGAIAATVEAVGLFTELAGRYPAAFGDPLRAAASTLAALHDGRGHAAAAQEVRHRYGA